MTATVTILLPIVNAFSGGLAPIQVEVGGKWGFIDKTGKEVIVPQYDQANTFRNGKAYVLLNGKWIYIDKTGDEIK